MNAIAIIKKPIKANTFDVSDEDAVNDIPDFHIGPLQPPPIYNSHVEDDSGDRLTE